MEQIEQLLDNYSDALASVGARQEAAIKKTNELLAPYLEERERIMSQARDAADALVPPEIWAQITAENTVCEQEMASIQAQADALKANIVGAVKLLRSTVKGRLHMAVFSKGQRKITNWDSFERFLDKLCETFQDYTSTNAASADPIPSGCIKAIEMIQAGLKAFIDHGEPSATVKAR